MNLLAVDTSTEACSVALHCAGQVYARFDIVPRQHQREVFRMYQAVLDECGIDKTALDALAFGCGPGSFTGTRVAAMFVQGLAFVYQLPVVAVSDLQALAQALLNKYPHKNKVLACLDARMGEIYYAYFHRGENNIAQRMGEEAVLACDQFVLDTQTEAVGGSGIRVTPTLSEANLDAVEKNLLPDARLILELAYEQMKAKHSLTAEQATPVYLRHPVMNKSS